ncbi:MAG: rhodanese-like domain-containing protein [Bacteroidota bacterium]
MTTSQVIVYALLALVILLYFKKWLLTRSLTHYSPGEVAERMKNSSILLDVRTSAERQRQNIKGSLHIPLHELGRRIDELSKHKNKEIICYCASGNRSVSAAAKLKKFGFTVANMKGGIAEWNSVGFR